MTYVAAPHRTRVYPSRHDATATPQSGSVPLPVAILFLALAHLFDLASYVVMTGLHGPSAEANPLVANLAAQLGLPGLTLAKVLAVVIGSCVFIVLAPQHRKLAMTVLVFGIAAGLVGGLTNLATI
jgi:hypothetical protein